MDEFVLHDCAEFSIQPEIVWASRNGMMNIEKCAIYFATQPLFATRHAKDITASSKSHPLAF